MIVKLNFLGKHNIIAIAIFPFIFIDPLKFYTNKSNLNHEKIHLRQQKEMFIILFYLWYLVEYLIRLQSPKAYRKISFEQEAYENEANENYLNERKMFSWIKYLN